MAPSWPGKWDCLPLFFPTLRGCSATVRKSTSMVVAAGWENRRKPAGEVRRQMPSIPTTSRVSCELIPPIPGRKDRLAARLRNALAAFWTAFLLAVFLLPERWARQPILALLDYVLWPIVRALGKPATVAILAAGVAVLSLLVQKLVTDNRRLREAKRRAAKLIALANVLPEDSPRRKVLLDLAAPVQLRGLLAAMVPVGILLGPMVMSFVWLQGRVDPLVSNAPPGSTAHVVAMVESDWSEPVRLAVPPPMVVDDTTPSSCTVSPVRKTLERLLALIVSRAASRVSRGRCGLPPTSPANRRPTIWMPTWPRAFPRRRSRGWSGRRKGSAGGFP